MPKKLLAQILTPKQQGLSGNNKPDLMILSSPWDKNDCAVKLAGAQKMLSETGYRVLNKGKIFFDDDSDTLTKLSKSQVKSHITIYLEAHGAPGWLFGNSPENELLWTMKFASFIKKLNTPQRGVETVVLSCCNSATEYLDPDSLNHFYSPARLLSLLLPQTNIVGFVGHNAGVKITHVWEKTDDGFVDHVYPLIEGAVSLQKGLVIESSARTLYCQTAEIPDCLKKDCGFDFTTPYFKHSDVYATLKSLGVKKSSQHYGQKQLMGLKSLSLESSDLAAAAQKSGGSAAAASASTHASAFFVSRTDENKEDNKAEDNKLSALAKNKKYSVHLNQLGVFSAPASHRLIDAGFECKGSSLESQ